MSLLDSMPPFDDTQSDPHQRPRVHDTNLPVSSSPEAGVENRTVGMSEDEIQELLMNCQPVKYKEKTAKLGSLLPELPKPILKSVTMRVQCDIKQFSADLFEEEAPPEDKLPAVLENKSADEIDQNPRLRALRRFSELLNIKENSVTRPTSHSPSLSPVSTKVPLDHTVEPVSLVQPAAVTVSDAVVEYVDAKRPAKVKYDQIETPAPELPKPTAPLLKATKAASQKLDISADETTNLDATRQPEEITTPVTTKVKYGHFDTLPPDMPKVPMSALKAMKSPSSPVPSEAEVIAPQMQAVAQPETAPPAPAAPPAPILTAPPLKSQRPENQATYPVARIPVPSTENYASTPTVSLGHAPTIQSIQQRPTDKIQATPGRVFSTGTTQTIPLNPRSHPSSAPTFWDRLKKFWKNLTNRPRRSDH